MPVETVLDCHAIIGESVTWIPSERALYWIDVKAPTLHRCCPEDRSYPLVADDERYRRLRAN